MVQNTLKYRALFFFALLPAAVMGGWLGALAADRDVPTIVYSAEAVTPAVEAGGELRIDYVVRRIRSCAVTIDRFVYDSDKVRYELPELTLNAGLPLGEDRFIQPVRVPSGVRSGPALYQTMATYICNPLQRLWPIHAGTRDIPFVIKAGEGE